jgi:general secretion pathway protein K
MSAEGPPQGARPPGGKRREALLGGEHTGGRGAAVVLAMLLAALAATVAATLLADQQRWIRTVEYRRDQVQAQAIAMAGVQWARQILFQDQRVTNIDHLNEPWAMSLPPIPIENGAIRGSIVDAQGLLNINDLGTSTADFNVPRARLARLFEQLGGPVKAQEAIGDWIDADAVTRPGGAEDGFYESLAVPGLAANALITRAAELGSVRGVSLRSLATVLPFLSALPTGTQVNVNTAPPEVLAAIIDNISADGLATLVASRKERPFTNIADFQARLPEGATVAGTESLNVRSSFFIINVEAKQGATVARVRALVQRSATGWPVVLWQVVE